MNPSPFKTGGPLMDEHAAVYIKRESDRDTLAHLRRMEYLLVVESRQQGKTSLIYHLIRHPALAHVAFAYVDVTSLERSSEAGWYRTLCSRLLRQLRRFIPRNQWPAIPQNAPGWRDFLSEVAILAQDTNQRVVIALDEIGAVTFSGATDFFSVLRDIYNSRQLETEFKQLTFLLVGAFNPRALIKDDKISPFNIAQRVRLADFTLAQVAELVGKGDWSQEQVTKLAERIHYWTDGQPYLTQVLCSYLAAEATPANVDLAISRLLVEDPNHLPSILERLENKKRWQKYVGRIMSGERIKFYPAVNPRHAQLELLGIIKGDELGHCTIRNRIYEQALSNAGSASDDEEITLLKSSLEKMPFWAYPESYRDTAYVLGKKLYRLSRFQEARQALVKAHHAIETLRRGLQQQALKQDLAAKNAEFYALLVCACLREGEERAAFEYAVAGKGRAFVDLLTSARFDVFAAGADDAELATDLRQARQLREQIDQLLTELAVHDDGTGDRQRRTPKLAQVRSLQRQERQYWQILASKYPALTATQTVPSLSASEAQYLADEVGATLVEFVEHAEGWSAFVVTAGAVRHVALDGVNDDFWQRWVLEWLNRIDKPKEHTKRLEVSLSRWYKALILPLKPYLPKAGKLVLAPTGFLHLMPLGIARHPDTKRYLSDEYSITFVPTLAALRVMLAEVSQRQPLQPTTTSLLTAAYPSVGSRYLSHVISEALAIAAHFPHVTPLHDQAATPQAVLASAKGQHLVHFSCHAGFDPELPEQSGFELCGGYLTVQRIITELRLSDARLATLSACQTHRVALKAGEEHVGLLRALMTAGVPTVVASLWSVPDKATRVLFEEFYKRVRAGESPAKALQEASVHVRQQQGWEHPYYWAAFQVSGLGYL